MKGRLVKLIGQLSGSRHNQRKSPFFVVEGLRCCREAIARRLPWLEGLLLSESFASSEDARFFQTASHTANASAEILPDADFAKLALTEGPQGVMLLMRKPEASLPTSLSTPCTLILDQVREPGNFGTILRTAWAVGATQVWRTSGSADPWAPKVVRSGMGAQFSIETHSFPDLESVGV